MFFAGWQASDLRHPDVGVHGEKAPSDPCRGLRRRQRHLGRLRLRHVVRRDCQGRLPHPVHQDHGRFGQGGRGLPLEPAVLRRSDEECKQSISVHDELFPSNYTSALRLISTFSLNIETGRKYLLHKEIPTQ